MIYSNAGLITTAGQETWYLYSIQPTVRFAYKRARYCCLSCRRAQQLSKSPKTGQTEETGKDGSKYCPGIKIFGGRVPY